MDSGIAFAKRRAGPARVACGVLGFGVAAILAGCAVGPRYEPPAAPATTHYNAVPTPATIPAAKAVPGPVGSAQALVQGQAVATRWWREFQSNALDQLIAQALAHNPDLAAANATLQQAQYELRATRGAFFPQISAGLSAQRTRTPATHPGSTGAALYNLYTGQVSVSYFPGAFGINRIAMRGQQATVDVARDQLDAARLSLAGNVVTTVFQLAALTDEVAAMQKNVASQRETLGLIKTRYQLGATTQFTVLTQQSELASTEAQLTQLEQARDATRHLLAMLVGEFPSASDTLQVPALADLVLPAALPLGTPSTLVANRPDIRAAEAQLRGANAEVAAAVARMYPHLQITADFGQQANHTGDLFNPASRLWDLAAGLAGPLFEGGTLRARKHAAEAAYSAMFAHYQSTVLGAFRDVADVLRALQHDATLLDARARAMRDAQQALALVTTKYQVGSIDYLSVLASETQYRSAQIAFVEAEAQRYIDSTALYVAQGGGQWETTQ